VVPDVGDVVKLVMTSPFRIDQAGYVIGLEVCVNDHLA
jgi:hypothetical protein